MEKLYKDKSIRRKRVWEIDALRGFCILLMIIDHAMFDFMYLPEWAFNFYEIDNPVINFISEFAEGYWFAGYRISIRIVVVSLFLLLSGISTSFSKSNGLRAVKLALAACILTLATILIDRFFDLGVTIIFGILHLLAASVIIYCVIAFFCRGSGLTKYFCLVAGIVLVIAGICIDYYDIPEAVPLSENIGALILGTKFFGADSFGLIPYTGLFMIGVYAGKTFYKNKASLLPALDKGWNRPLCFVGRNTMWVYLLHQPLVLGAIALICIMLGYKFF